MYMYTFAKCLKELLFILVAIGLSIMVSISISNLLYNFVDGRVSKIIGIVIVCVLEFFMYQYIFMKKIEFSNWFVITYIIVSTIAVFISHYVFVWVECYVKTHKPQYYDKSWKNHIIIYKFLIYAIVYILYQFPLYKWVVFKKKEV